MSIPISEQYIAKRFGEKLRSLRLQRKITLKELALSLGLKAHGYLSEIENNRKVPTVELVLRVSRLFSVTTDELLKDELQVLIPNPQKDKDE